MRGTLNQGHRRGLPYSVLAPDTGPALVDAVLQRPYRGGHLAVEFVAAGQGLGELAVEFGRGPVPVGVVIDVLRQVGHQRGVEVIAVRAEGLDPDDPAVVAAIDMVRWELSLGT